MSLRRTVTRNAAWNWAGLATIAISGFVVAPFLVHRLGQEAYGLWILILSLAGTLAFLDLGLRGSISRYVAYHAAQGDGDAVVRTKRTAQWMMLGVGAAVLVGTVGIQWLFGPVFAVRTERVGDVRLAMLLAGASVAVTLAMAVYDATLWAKSRFDLINAIEMTCNAAQATAAILLLRRGHFLVALAASLLITTSLKESAKWLACRCVAKDQNARHVKATWETARRLVIFGWWTFLRTLGLRATAQSVPMIIGARLSPLNVTPYNIASSLTLDARSFVGAGAEVVAPLATALHAADRKDDQQRLFIDASKYSWALTLLLCAGLMLLGRSFLTLWMGQGIADGTWLLLVVLTLGEALPMSQRFASNVIQAHGRHRVLAVASLIEAGAVLILGLALIRADGLNGICVIVAGCGLLTRGVVPIVYACRILEVSLRRYAMEALLTPLVAAVIPAAVLAMLVRQRAPANWMEFIVYAVGFSAAFGVLCVLLLRRTVNREIVWQSPVGAESL